MLVLITHLSSKSTSCWLYLCTESSCLSHLPNRRVPNPLAASTPNAPHTEEEQEPFHGTGSLLDPSCALATATGLRAPSSPCSLQASSQVPRTWATAAPHAHVVTLPRPQASLSALCPGENCVPKTHRLSPIPQCLSMGPYLEIGCLTC